MASTNAFTVRLFTPAGMVFDEEADSVKLPAIDGQIGVLPQHTKYCGLLGSGAIEFTSLSGRTQRCEISGGLIRFSRNTLTVLADRVEAKSE